MVEKLTGSKQVNQLAGFVEPCNFVAGLYANIQDIWRRIEQYLNIIVGCVAAAYTLSLAASAWTAKTTISVSLFPMHCIVAPIVIVCGLVYLVYEANSKLTTQHALNQSRQDFAEANSEHKARIERLNVEHERKMEATQKELADVLGKFTEHAQEIYNQLAQQKVDFQEMGRAQEALYQVIQEHTGGNLGQALEQVSKVVEALGQIAHLPENLKTIAIQLKEAQTRYDTLNKRHEELLDRFEKGLKKAHQ